MLHICCIMNTKQKFRLQQLFLQTAFEKVFGLVWFGFPFGVAEHFLFLIQLKRWNREQSYTEMKYDSKILCNSSFWYCFSFRCSLTLFFTLSFRSEHREILRTQRTSLNVFPFFHLDKFIPLSYSTNATEKSPGAYHSAT